MTGNDTKGRIHSDRSVGGWVENDGLRFPCVWRPIVTSMKMPTRSRVNTALPFHSLGSFEVFPLINLQPNFRRHFVVLFYLLLHVKDNVAIYKTNFPIYPLV